MELRSSSPTPSGAHNRRARGEFGDGGAGVLTVGGERYELRTRSEASEVLCISEERGACATVGRVAECLEVQATLDGEARERVVKRRSEQAEREKKEAHRTIYDDGSKPAKKARAGAAAVEAGDGARAKPGGGGAGAGGAARRAPPRAAAPRGARRGTRRRRRRRRLRERRRRRGEGARVGGPRARARAGAGGHPREAGARRGADGRAAAARAGGEGARALNLVAERGDEGRYKLLESARAEVSEQWPHYTQQQRANLAANNAMRGAAARGAAAAPAAAPARRSGAAVAAAEAAACGGPSSQPPQPQPPLVVRTQEAFRRYKKEFNKKYPRYASARARARRDHRADLRLVEQQFSAATDEKARVRLSKEIERRFTAAGPVMKAKADERRALHVAAEAAAGRRERVRRGA